MWLQIEGRGKDTNVYEFTNIYIVISSLDLVRVVLHLKHEAGSVFRKYLAYIFRIKGRVHKV